MHIIQCKKFSAILNCIKKSAFVKCFYHAEHALRRLRVADMRKQRGRQQKDLFRAGAQLFADRAVFVKRRLRQKERVDLGAAAHGVLADAQTLGDEQARLPAKAGAFLQLYDVFDLWIVLACERQHGILHIQQKRLEVPNADNC